MAVMFRRDEELPVERPAGSDPGHDAATLCEGAVLALRSTIVVLVGASVVLAFALSALKRAIVAADQLLQGGGEHWTEMWMPGVLLAFFGAIFGGLVAWRSSSAASLGTAAAFVVGIIASLVLAAVGAAVFLVLFPNGMRTMCWICLGMLLLGSGISIYLYARWTH